MIAADMATSMRAYDEGYITREGYRDARILGVASNLASHFLPNDPNIDNAVSSTVDGFSRMNDIRHASNPNSTPVFNAMPSPSSQEQIDRNTHNETSEETENRRQQPFNINDFRNNNGG